MKSKTTLSRMNPQEQFKISALITEHCKKNEEDVAVYEAGWSDRRILDELPSESRERLNIGHVQRIREALVGKTLRGEVSLRSHDLRLRELEEYVLRLEERVKLIEAWAGRRPKEPLKHAA